MSSRALTVVCGVVSMIALGCAPPSEHLDEGGGAGWDREVGEEAPMLANQCTELDVFGRGGVPLEIYAAPSLLAEVVGEVVEGTRLQVHERDDFGAWVADGPVDGSNIWYRVSIDSTEGWITSIFARCAPHDTMDETLAWSWPVPTSDWVTQSYGNPVDYGCEYHAGIDVGASEGASIVAAASGQVVHVGELWGPDIRGPHSIVIDHGGGTYTTYSHNAESYVVVGQSVSGGQTIGTIGSLGYSTGPHLHFELLEDAEFTGDWSTPFRQDCSKYRNPHNYVRPQGFGS